MTNVTSVDFANHHVPALHSEGWRLCMESKCAATFWVETDRIAGATFLYFHHGDRQLKMPLGGGAEMKAALKYWLRLLHQTPLWVPHQVPRD